MSANAHAFNRIDALIFVLLVTAALKWLRWRNAKASGMTRSQFADVESRPGERLLVQAQWSRLSGWILVLLPIVVGAISQIRHPVTLFMFIALIVFLEILLGGLGWFMLWNAKQIEERARQIGATP
jgi:uncharacterized membrane protein YhaH (DUF805 family)